MTPTDISFAGWLRVHSQRVPLPSTGTISVVSQAVLHGPHPINTWIHAPQVVTPPIPTDLKPSGSVTGSEGCTAGAGHSSLQEASPSLLNFSSLQNRL